MRSIQLLLVLAAVYSAPSFAAAIQGVHCTLELSDKAYQPVSFDLSASFPANDSGVAITDSIPLVSADPSVKIQVGFMVEFWRDDLSSPNANKFYMDLFDYTNGAGEHPISWAEGDPSAPITKTIFGDTSVKGLQATGSCTSY